jgi:ParB/RepB/Spo0J family partition protein
MKLTNKYTRVPIASITINRESRQRTELFDSGGKFIDPDGLVDSIKSRGVMSPILITRDMTLVFGERRLTASKLAGLIDIPARFVEDLDPIEAQVLELEENLKRNDLSWQDKTRAIARLHDLYCSDDPKWTHGGTAESIGVSQSQITEFLRVARDIKSPRIAQATSVRAAYNILSRVDERLEADTLSDILDTGQAVVAQALARPVAQGNTIVAEDVLVENLLAPVTPPESIVVGDFCEWAATYVGPAFNFIHCDFPYGINVFDGAMSGRDKWETYPDTRETYEKLIKALCDNLDRLMSHSAHLMFWCAADIEIQHDTISRFRSLAPSLKFQTYPLVWHKTDNVGVLPDPKRDPRRVYETALIASREDRQVVRSVSNAYGAPTDKAHHTSTKPEPVLRHFFQMFVDENTRMLDPTCGSGSALRAAESLGADHVFGLEFNAEHAENARKALRSFRILRKLDK